MVDSTRALLTDPALKVLDVPAAAHGVAWLRSSVARFCEGQDHQRRRAQAQALLATVDPTALRTVDGNPDEMFAEALGVPRSVASDVAIVAAVYQPHLPSNPAADHALDRLVHACGGRRDEETAARIGLLVQAHTATAALIAGVNPPVASTCRTTPTGDTQVVELTGLAFGAGAHACPGRAHALALAASQLPFHRLHDGPTPLVLPNAWDCASAATFVQAGFQAVGTTSLGVASAHGHADATGTTLRQTLNLAAQLVRLPVPITIDLEAGLGADPQELAAQLWEMGIAGVNLEDGRGDHLADPVEQADLLRTFKDAAPAMFVNARTDTHWLQRDLSSTVTRIQRYEDAGADGVFVPGLSDDHAIADIVASTALPLNVLAQPDLQRLRDLGVRRVSTGSLPFRAALAAALKAAENARDGLPGMATAGYRAVDDLAKCYETARAD